MNEATPPYIFFRGQRGIFAEVYFPKKVIYQSEVFTALQEGFLEETVKKYFERNISGIIQEMGDYPQLFDPHQYERDQPVAPTSVSVEEARQRIATYQSRFYGSSMYEVDGVFWSDTRQKIIDERTQIIRLIFRIESSFTEEARRMESYDVLEAMKRWIMAEHNRLDHVLPWSKEEQDHFIVLHGVWPEHKREFVVQYYERVAKEAKRWIDDINLFIFGYLVRRFWKEVVSLHVREQDKEEELWVASFFNLNLNIVKLQKEK